MNGEAVRLLTGNEKSILNVGRDAIKLLDCRCLHVDGPCLKPVRKFGSHVFKRPVFIIFVGGQGVNFGRSALSCHILQLQRLAPNFFY